MNNWNFTGNLGNPAEVKVLSTGTTVCEFSVAVKSGYGDKEKTNWVKCSLFGKKAEGRLPEFLQKGTQVAVNGELELQKWDGGAGLALRVSDIDLIGGAPQGQSQAPQQNQGGYAPQQQSAPQSGYHQQNNASQQSQPVYQGGGGQANHPQGVFNPDDLPF
ncbi:single-stranded DNA-binding protein [Pseudoalteromonas phage BS5]|uniref:single-stranded DNA-binding protein n=1 Tax=Pseudoalteromonas phage BS5 TaxID=1874539 RepID=UPI0008199216|nr:single-stranded DNA-binding protein [Pseudoalteromonas phage BS5]ANY29598.1 single-stranded DNA-binding protein [Pseudoalteromonas phage BS5]